MTKRRAPAKNQIPVKKPELPETEEQDPDEIEISLKTDPNAMQPIDCGDHYFVFLRTAKIKGNVGPREGKRYRRVDSFYCVHCLRYTTVAREEVTKIAPDWFMGN